MFQLPTHKNLMLTFKLKNRLKTDTGNKKPTKYRHGTGEAQNIIQNVDSKKLFLLALTASYARWFCVLTDVLF